MKYRYCKPNNYSLYENCVSDIIETSIVKSMDNYTQHADITTLEHSVFVSYLSFGICKKLGLNYYAAARGGLLHDLFLYDWHNEDKPCKFHGFRHPGLALKNANLHFNLSKTEQDIIKKHMWPLTVVPPRFNESYVVCIADKICTLVEVFRLYKLKKIYKYMTLHKSMSFAGSTM